MSDWVGFSDADLRRMKSGTESNNEPQNRAKILKPLTGGHQKVNPMGAQKQQRKQNPRVGVKKPPRNQGEIPSAARLSKPPVHQAESKPKISSPPTTPSDQIPLHGKTFPSVSDSTGKPLSEDAGGKLNEKEPEIVEDEEIILQKEKIKFEDIQRRQKEMEEKNKRKKTMLTKAIAERKKRAFAESHKLIKIQEELAKLDTMLNYDVSILRDKIDEACWEFNHAKKRFDKAEVEYIEAKMHLHKATEMKEELTEHLYQLIQLNEERKADKLEDLMNKLELEEDGDVELEAEIKEPTIESLKPEESSENPSPKQEEVDSKQLDEEVPRKESVGKEETDKCGENSKEVTEVKS